MTRLQDLFALSFFLPGFLCSFSGAAHDMYQLPPESLRETAGVRGSLFLLRAAIRKGDVCMLESVLDRDHAEEDVMSGPEQAMGLIPDLLRWLLDHNSYGED